MPKSKPDAQQTADSRTIRRNLDEQGSSLLVIERENPGHILVTVAYAKDHNALVYSVNRNRVVCTTFGNELERFEYDIDNLAIYRSF